MTCPFAQNFSSKELQDRASVQTEVNGNPVSDSQTSLTIGPRGLLAFPDTHLMDKMAHQNRERIPERAVHAKGWGMHGVFKVTHDITKYTKAAIFSEVGKETEVLSRWSNVAGERGAADAERDLRGFALKFYTEEGNWDLVGNNTPVFFIRDPAIFPDFIRTQKRNPLTNLRSMEARFDFWSMHPESIHQVMWLFGDRGLPLSPMHMDGFGSHTYSMVNAANERVWVKFHMKTHQGTKFLTNCEANEVIAKTRESFQEQLIDAIADGKYPKWTMYIQVMTLEQAKTFRWNPFDLTKVWPHADFPLIEVGELTFNRIPSNYHVFVEQSAFCPANLVPGISFSPDRMLQARMLSYSDAARYRLGVAHETLPPNIPKRCPLGFMGFDGAAKYGCPDNGNPDAYYDLSSYGGPRPTGVEDPPFEVEPGAVVARHRQEMSDLDYEQPRALWEKVYDKPAQERMLANMAGDLVVCSAEVRKRMVELLTKVSPDCGERMQKVLDKELAKKEDDNGRPVKRFMRFLAARISGAKIGPRLGWPGAQFLVGDARHLPESGSAIRCTDLGEASKPVFLDARPKKGGQADSSALAVDRDGHGMAIDCATGMPKKDEKGNPLSKSKAPEDAV